MKGKRISDQSEKKNQVYVCLSIFNLYLSILASIANKPKNVKSYLVYYNLDSAFSPLISQLKQCEYFDEMIGIPDIRHVKSRSILGRVKNLLFFPSIVNTHFEKLCDLKNLQNTIANSEINVFATTTLFLKYIFINFPHNHYRILEDGLITYRKVHNPISRIIQLIHGVPYRSSDSIFKEIWVSHPQNLPLNAQKKAKKVILEDYIKPLSPLQKTNVVDFFLKDLQINNSKENKILVITQPLSEDGYISEAYKISLYKKIVDQYSRQNSKIYLKKHPREKTNYENEIPSLDGLIPGNFPLEILNLNPFIKFKTGITIFSSALENCNFIEEKIYLGEEWDPKIHNELQNRFKMNK
jgi:hypothetical protein